MKTKTKKSNDTVTGVKIPEDKLVPIHSNMADKRPSPLTCLIRKDSTEAIMRTLQTLDERERCIIDYRFGLTNGYCSTLAEVSQIFGVCSERIRCLEARALRKLRHPKRLRSLGGSVMQNCA